MAGISERELLKLKADGWQSDLMDMRLRYAEIDSVLKYVRPLVGQGRAHPRMLPTQKSGRWSTKEPPLVNFSANCINPDCPTLQAGVEHKAVSGVCWSLRDTVQPDPGTYFIKWDWSAIEARLAAAYSEDDEDLDLFERGADIHTATLCKMYGIPQPPDIMSPYKAESCAAWRVETGLTNSQCWQRTGAKTSRYSLAYGADERAIHQAKDVDKLAQDAGLDKKGIEAMAKAYLTSKPKLVAWKYRVWNQIIDTQEVRTPLGRRKRLFVTEEERAQWKRTRKATHACKEGLNHLAQGQVADMMNLTIIAIKRRWPESRLAFQSHDGHCSVWPEGVDPFPEIKEIVERSWSMGNGRSVRSIADWSIVRDDGSHEEVR